jgi:hypothetical protein
MAMRPDRDRGREGCRRHPRARRSRRLGWPMTAIDHMTSDDKTIAIIVLAEALLDATLVGDPAPQVARLGDWMTASPQIGDLVVEMSTKHRGPSIHRVGVVLEISQHKSAYARVTEILLLDPPCGSKSCNNQECIHRRRWSNATFVRLPATAARLAEALGRKTPGDAGAGRDDLICALTDAGFKLKPSCNQGSGSST